MELVDIERSGGSGVAWLSQTRANSMVDSGFKSDRTASIETDTTAIWSDEEGDEVGDKLSSPCNKPLVASRIKRTRLKRAQSERVPSVEGTPPPLPPRGGQHNENKVNF